MDLEIAPQHATLRNAVRELAQSIALPLAEEVDRDHRFPLEAVKAASEAGLLGVLIPTEYGGAGLDALAFAICIEELAQACASTSVIVDVHTSVGSEPILLFGTEDQKRKWLPRLASGELLGAFALTEPASGSDASSLKASARRTGSGYVLNGTKTFITNVGHAGLYVVFARSGPEERAAGVSAFLVPADTPGLRIGQVFKKMGLNGSPTGELVLEDVVVPQENRLGSDGQGFTVAMRALDSGRIGISGQALGIAISAAVVYAQTAMQEHPERADETRELAEAFCNQAQHRTERLFHELWSNADAGNHRLALDVLSGRHTWLEEGVIDPSTGDGPMVPPLETDRGVPVEVPTATAGSGP